MDLLINKTVEIALAADDIEHLQISEDTDAEVGNKTADSSFFEYKTHMAMSEERIITAAVVMKVKKMMENN